MKNVDMKECFKKHPMLHMLTGIGVGLLVIGLVPALAANAVMIGIILVVVGIGSEFVFGQS